MEDYSIVLSNRCQTPRKGTLQRKRAPILSSLPKIAKITTFDYHYCLYNN